MQTLRVESASKSFGGIEAVRGVSFGVAQGEFVSLLGPSGCGKTTLLRLVAGLIEPSSGKIYLDEVDVTSVPAYRRNTGMVFQSYALFPHMSVYKNIAFGLRMRKVKANHIPDRVRSALRLIKLEDYGERMPKELSGGQQQRVALARAIAIEPAVLLLDEPLSNLDARLRDEMRIEIKQIQKKVGITAVFVTHDQEEALSLSDRILLMNEGRIVEEGTPASIYSCPTSSFAATFIGNSNRLYGKVVDVVGEHAAIMTERGLAFRGCIAIDLRRDDEVLTLIRQERIRLRTEPPGREDEEVNMAPCEIMMVTFLGGSIEYMCMTSGHELRVRRPNEGRVAEFTAGRHIWLEWNAADSIIVKG